VPRHVGQADISTIVPVGQSFVVNAQKVQDRRVYVVDADTFLHSLETKGIGFPESDAPLDSTARHPHGKGMRVVVSPRFVASLHDRQTPELSPPDHQGFFEQASLLQNVLKGKSWLKA